MHVTLLIQFLDLRGNCGLQTASEVKSDLEFEISDLNYPCIHVHVTLLIPLFISPRPLRPPNNLGGQIWPQIWNQWPKEPMWPKFQGTFVSHFRNFSRLKSACSWPALALQVKMSCRHRHHHPEAACKELKCLTTKRGKDAKQRQLPFGAIWRQSI